MDESFLTQLKSLLYGGQLKTQRHVSHRRDRSYKDSQTTATDFLFRDSFEAIDFSRETAWISSSCTMCLYVMMRLSCIVGPLDFGEEADVRSGAKKK